MISFNFDPITDRLLVGAAPTTPEQVDQLQAVGVGAVLNLQTDSDLAYHGIDWPALSTHYRRRQLWVTRHPIVDFSPSQLRDRLPGAVAALVDLMDRANVVYLHCNVGVNRSPTTAIAYLHRHCGMSLVAAEGLVRARRDCVPWVAAISAADWGE